MTTKNNFRDPRGHSLRIYADLFDSPAFKSLSPYDVMAYLALLRQLKATNNGDLSLPLTKAAKCGISHHMTLARSLRALCAVGLVAVTRKGGCAKGGTKLTTLYRMTYRECYAFPVKHLDAIKETNEWKLVTTIQHGHELIQDAEVKAKSAYEKKINLGHGMTYTGSPRDVVKAKTRSRRDTRADGPGHGVTMVENTENPMLARVSEGFSPNQEKAPPRSPRVPPLYIAKDAGECGRIGDHGRYLRLSHFRPGLFTKLVGLAA